MNLCIYCNKRLVSIGLNRTNGKGHADWEGRTLHKKCWKDVTPAFWEHLKKQKLMDVEFTSDSE